MVRYCIHQIENGWTIEKKDYSVFKKQNPGVIYAKDFKTVLTMLKRWEEKGSPVKNIIEYGEERYNKNDYNA